MLAVGAIHLYLYFDYFHRVATIGTLFLLNAAAALLIAAWVAGRDRLAPLVAGLLFSAGTLAAFFASVAVGLFGYHERLRGPWQEAAGVVEGVATVVFLVLIATRARRRSASSARLHAV